ncbi:TPA: hypothetical protein L6A25_30500 [Pseudomonas aeruginosa]|uniref:hypothetical protein n=1 Tax=Pseudomonas qingdaonensis TaxID=2056231 RepID=UPI00265DC400|nr:hypothetical protein [Pseudomonas qingdaonensis]WKL67265.1 hypothetical protein Q1Z72_00890 [Pseudomonas qingdaonensis]HBP5954176.1 hypothetical protein [Pseudomonas aeruginosa]HBP6061864.1 hypothetical protein [Pseudomonas aeruginosa]HBP6483563.1 hypothetical protein [Pseudomonas aeruginosa]
MKTFAQACTEYRAACEAVSEHQRSEMAVDIRTKKHLEKFSAYSDLTHWPESHLLEGMGETERAELVVWGDQYAEQLKIFHGNTETLIRDRFQALCIALEALGYETGKAFLERHGAFDIRVHGVLGEADKRRKTELDGIGYVCIREQEGHFAKGFFKASGLKRDLVYAGLRRCAELRQSGLDKADVEELKHYGMLQEVSDESR